ncbi:hypothetical protein E1B28_006012 [Marasmius oreades]|uniref:Uncharacterized protein n=1 Tax=Marasmius oreades TaxID=181124 RepID=A0A9P7UV61_9AGAR|nr:uncharacterized protein E1B28_006012 [Marasmius oreades]KAG7095238.1 hypothetical protein E1B28_006012 [Marasmius oreades]
MGRVKHKQHVSQMVIPIIFSPSTLSEPSLSGPLARISDSELLLLEFQGEIHVDSEEGDVKSGQLVGTLTIDEGLTRPALRIGHNQLEGKLVTLAKPLAVLRKQRPKPQPQQNFPDETNYDENTVNLDQEEELENMNMVMATSLTPQAPTEWHGIALIRRKIVFSKRPMPIVGIGKTSSLV